MWFVWVEKMGKTTCEKWSEESGDCDMNGHVKPFLKKVHLPEAMMHVSLDTLAKQFPLVEVSDERSTVELQEDNSEPERGEGLE